MVELKVEDARTAIKQGKVEVQVQGAQQKAKAGDMQDLSDQAKQKATAKLQENRSTPEVQQKVRAAVLEPRPATTKPVQKVHASDGLGGMAPLGTPPRQKLTQQPSAPLSAPLQMVVPQASPAISPSIASLPMMSPIAPNGVGVGGSMTMSMPAAPSLKDQLVELVRTIVSNVLYRSFSQYRACLLLRAPFECSLAELTLSRRCIADCRCRNS
jgi:hypothetical protein